MANLFEAAHERYRTSRLTLLRDTIRYTLDQMEKDVKDESISKEELYSRTYIHYTIVENMKMEYAFLRI